MSCLISKGGDPLEQGATASGEIQPLAQPEGVVIRDDDLGALQIAQHVTRNQLAAGVVAIRVMGLEHAQAIADGQTGCDDQETARERLAVGPTHRIDRVPGHQHGHDGGLASASGQFQRQPHERWVGVVVGISQMFQEGGSSLTSVRGNLGEPDGGFNRFHLAEEWPDVTELVMPPMLEQPGGFGRDLPVVRIRQAAPLIDLLPNGVNDCGMVVLLFLCGKPLAFVEHDRLLCG